MTNLKRRFAALFIALAVASGIIAVATPAYALNPPQCTTTNELCFWADANYQGDFLYSVNVSVGVCYNIAPFMNDRVTAVWNRYPGNMVIYEEANCAKGIFDAYQQISSGQSIGQLTNFMNDKTSSYKRV